MTEWHHLSTAPINVELQVYFAESEYVGLATKDGMGRWQAGESGYVKPSLWTYKATPPSKSEPWKQ